jgi:alpha-N-arabinofuranosidase
MTAVRAGAGLRGAGEAWRLSGTSLEAYNKVGAAPQVTIVRGRAAAPDGVLTVPPLTVSIYEFPIAGRQGAKATALSMVKAAD